MGRKGSSSMRDRYLKGWPFKGPDYNCKRKYFHSSLLPHKRQTNFGKTNCYSNGHWIVCEELSYIRVKKLKYIYVWRTCISINLLAESVHLIRMFKYESNNALKNIIKEETNIKRFGRTWSFFIKCKKDLYDFDNRNKQTFILLL